ncbi:unnamed protein product [Microthlaspi erraticum]|uniref:CCHC-type domain-containing protein n=1 Tax=Microthlaspi erraticum TaxID=1685480 RepID=A0A6D2KQ03_9BRAS|nr:unnamed protein product [Microthlaspi erraticum]
MSDWFVDDEGSWFSTGQVWTAESGSSSSEPSSNSEHWIVVTDLEQQTLTDHDSSSDWDEDVYLMPRDNVQPSTTVNEYSEHMTWPVHYPEEERMVPPTQIIEISSGETTPNSWDRDSPPSVLPHIPMPHVFAPGGGVYPYMPTEDNPTDYMYPFITTGVESNDQPLQFKSIVKSSETNLKNRIRRNQHGRIILDTRTYHPRTGQGNSTRSLDIHHLWSMEKEAYLKIKEKLMRYGVQYLNQTTEEGTGDKEWPQDDEGLNLARRWDEIIATELENLRTEGNGLEGMVSCQRGRPPRRLARMRVPAPSQVTLPCDQCGGTGHHSRACPNVRVRSRMNERQNICLTCGEKGHFSADCPRNCPNTSQPIRSTTRRERRPGSGSRRM